MTDKDVIQIFGDRDIQIDKFVSIPTYKFAEIFKEAPSKPTYDDLIKIDNGKLGYERFLKRCKEKGILN